MNGEPSTFTVGVIGFEPAECRVLRRLVGLSEHRQPAFGPFNKDSGGCPHVVVVNADERSAMDKWSGYRRQNAHRAAFAPIFVTRQPTDSPGPGPYLLYRPILTTQLFSMLDQVVTEVHGFRPPAKASTEGSLVALTPVERAPNPEAMTARSELITISQAEHPASPGKVELRGSPAAAQTAALMFDDTLSPRARLQLRETLSPIASRVDFAESGEMAHRLIDRYAYSVIFLDALLQDDDAYELCGQIKKHPLQQQASTVMLTASASPAERVMGALAGFDHFLTKPIRVDSVNELATGLARPAAAL